MDKRKIGNAIAYLRKRAGYTQKDLADRIGISDKAVSKWERGLGLPDITYFGKLSILLDTDTDSLLAGDVIHHDKEWSGLLIIPESLEGVGAETLIFDKPLVYILLSYFLLVGIKNICIVSSQKDRKYIESKFGDGKILGIELAYCDQQLDRVLKQLDDRSDYSNLMVVYGKSFIYGVDQTRFFQRAMRHTDRITVLSLPKKTNDIVKNDKTQVGTEGINTFLSFNNNKKIVESDSDERIYTQYDYYEIPVMFCPKDKIVKLLHQKEDGQLTIRLSGCKDEQLYTEVLDRGFIEMPVDNRSQVMDVSILTQLVQKACGMEIYCLEEIAWRRGMINIARLKEFGKQKQKTNYGKYILGITEKYEKYEIQ